MSEIEMNQLEICCDQEQRNDHPDPQTNLALHSGAAMSMQRSSAPSELEWPTANQAASGSVILSSFYNRLKELERENLRLQGLVAELLLKNQQLRVGS